MTNTRRRAMGLVGALALTLSACAAGHDEDGDGFGQQGFRINGPHGRCVPALPGRPGGGGDWIGNGLDDVQLGGIDVGFGLSMSKGMSETGDVLAIEELRGTAEYLVECALPEGERIVKVVDGQTLEFHGQLGLAPQWKDDACDVDCQQWVTACLLARTNTSGQGVDIWLSAEHPSIGLGVSSDFPHYEATYYGNLFEGSPSQSLCLGSEAGVVASSLNGRTCAGEDPEACGFTSYGACEDDMRCQSVGSEPWVFHTECAEADPELDDRFHSISVHVAEPGRPAREVEPVY